MTFSGKPKPFYFRDHRDRFINYAEKIIWVPVFLSREQLDFSTFQEGYAPGSATALMERLQRNAASSVLSHGNPWDIVLTGDLDEIPEKNALRSMVKLYNDQKIDDLSSFVFSQLCFYYNFKQAMKKLWAGTVISRNLVIQTDTPQKLRDNRWKKQAIRYGGWHLSYFMTPEKIVEKLQSFVHQEYNKLPYTDIEYIKSKIASGEDFLDKDQFIKLDKNGIYLEPALLECFSFGV
jgi:beta-1,4-mannosyl-glycoprotein beta-1,4-N-acetylglucosaminyltransferase